MVKTEETLRLIVIDDSSNHAEVVGSMLRNAGYPVRAERAEDDEDLRTHLSQQSWDMVLTQPELPHFSAIEALNIIAQTEIDIPLIVLVEEVDDAVLSELFKAGARDVVTLKRPVSLIHTLIREFHDVQRRRRHRDCESLLQEANKRAQMLVDNSRDAIAYVHEGMYIYANDTYLQMFGYSTLEDIEGMPLMDMVSSSDHAKFKEFLRGYLKKQANASSIEVQGRKASGEEFNMAMEFSAASYDGEPCIQIIIRAQTVSKELEEKLDSLSKQDILTGAYNRQYFMQILDGIVGQTGIQGALLYITPDNFKATRERLGIAGSDAVITDFASTLKKFLPGSDDMLARFDSDVFTIILRDVDEDEAQNLSRKLLKQIEEHIFDAHGQTLSLTGSIGIALYHEDISDPQELLQRAEKAYRKAANSGNTMQYYNPLTEGMAEREQASLRVKQLKGALRDNRFQLHYQPIVSLHGDTVENYEILLRMLDENNKTLAPDDFLPAAQQSGLMNAIDRWVLVHSVKVLVERHRQGKQTNFFVKLSADSLKDENFLPWLRDLLSTAKVDGSNLTLEMSETAISSNLKVMPAFVDGLRKLRIRFAIDHFGIASNYANLLRHCDADILKIDGSIIRGIAQNADNQAKVKEITAMASEAGKKSIAESVEDANTLAIIWTCGPDYIQGYFLQEPDASMNYDFTSA